MRLILTCEMYTYILFYFIFKVRDASGLIQNRPQATLFCLTLTPNTSSTVKFGLLQESDVCLIYAVDICYSFTKAV